MSVAFRDKALEEHGQTRLVLSGEVQYFRTPKPVWKTALRRLQDAHCDTVSTYVPWSWHEPANGRFDFTGRTHPCRDLEGFLKLCADMGFKLVLKPGPYVFAELKNGGVPQWFSDAHPETLSLGPDRKTLASRLKFQHITYCHPTYMEAATRWLGEAWAAIAPHKDRTLLWQVDNEINYSHTFFWFGPHHTDYHPFLIKDGMYQAWLRDTFGGNLAALNARYQSRFKSFAAVEPPVASSPQPGEICRSLDWVAFKEWLAIEQVRRCCDHLHGLGVPGPFCVNAPFTGWGTAWNNTKRILTGTTPYGERSEPKGGPPPYEVVIAHVDYPGIVYDANAGETLGLIHYARAANNVLETNLETQACTVSRIWGKFGTSYDLTHKSLVGSGMNVVNYYWFNDGVNFAGSGHYQESHEYHCPLDVRGRPRPHYFAIKRLNRFLAAHPEIASTAHRADVSVGFLHEFGRSAFTAARVDPVFDHRTNALLNLLSACGVTFDLLDLKDWDPAATRPKTLFLQPPKFLPRFAMAKLAAYVKAGGRLILSNFLPVLDEDLRPCLDLAKALGSGKIMDVPAQPGPLEPHKIRIAGKEMFVIDRVQTYRPGKGARTLATGAGGILGYERRIGKGRVTVLGWRLEYLFTDLHRQVLGSLLGRNLDAPLVITRSGNGVTLKTAVNLDDDPVVVRVDGKTVTLPPKRAAFVLTRGRRREVFV